jgi:hypothetical protein
MPILKKYYDESFEDRLKDVEYPKMKFILRIPGTDIDIRQYKVFERQLTTPQVNVLSYSPLNEKIELLDENLYPPQDICLKKLWT